MSKDSDKDSDKKRSLEKDSEGKQSKKQRQECKECTDQDCGGCAVGDVELELIAEQSPSGADLHGAAREEIRKWQAEKRNGSNEGEEHRRIIVKLFEVATAKFEEQIAAESRSSVSVGGICNQVEASGNQDDYIQYAACLFDYGMFTNATIHIQKALDVLLRHVKPGWSQPDASQAYGWLLLGKCYACICEREAQVHIDNGLEMSEKQRSFTTEAIDALNQAFALDPTSIGLLIKASRALLELGLVQHEAYEESETTACCFEASLVFIDAFFSLQLDASLREAVRMKRDKGLCLFHLASLQQETEDPLLAKQALEHAKGAIECFQHLMALDPNAQSHQLMGEALMLQSTLEEDDEDMAVAAYDEAVVQLKQALALDPTNQDIQKQLQDIGEN